MTTKVRCIIKRAKNDGLFKAEGWFIGGEFAHTTRYRKSLLGAKVEMNNWCKKKGFVPVWIGA